MCSTVSERWTCILSQVHPQHWISHMSFLRHWKMVCIHVDKNKEEVALLTWAFHLPVNTSMPLELLLMHTHPSNTQMAWCPLTRPRTWLSTCTSTDCPGQNLLAFPNLRFGLDMALLILFPPLKDLVMMTLAALEPLEQQEVGVKEKWATISKWGFLMSSWLCERTLRVFSQSRKGAWWH